MQKLIYFQTKQQALLFERIAELGARTISPVLDKWVKGEITATPQDDALASHTSKITKEMGLIDWHQPAHKIVNLIRGLNPAPGCYFFLTGETVKDMVDAQNG